MNGNKMTANDIVKYLTEHDVLSNNAQVEVESLGGGVSNMVFRVVSNGDCIVVKQPLPNLAVRDDWPADISRVHNEAAAARVYTDIVNDASLSRVCVPEVIFENHNDHIIAVTCAPRTTTMWKHQLLDGTVNSEVAHTLGEFLGTSHTLAASDDDLQEMFADRTPFEQLRLNPYHRTVADRHLDVASSIETEIKRIRGVKHTLIHGDFSPKNVLVTSDAETPIIWILDFEVAHWGDPAFDTAFMINHLLIKSVYNHYDQQAYFKAAEVFWSTYCDCVNWDIELETIRELAILMLARVDGKSPVEYVTHNKTKDTLRTIAKQALKQDITTFGEYISLIEEVDRE